MRVVASRLDSDTNNEQFQYICFWHVIFRQVCLDFNFLILVNLRNVSSIECTRNELNLIPSCTWILHFDVIDVLVKLHLLLTSALDADYRHVSSAFPL